MIRFTTTVLACLLALSAGTGCAIELPKSALPFRLGPTGDAAKSDATAQQDQGPKPIAAHQLGLVSSAR
jgi:hypothetical protein